MSSKIPPAQGRPVLSVPLSRYYYSQGYSAGMALDEYQPVVPFAQEQLDRLFFRLDLPIDQYEAACGQWSLGFQNALMRRIAAWSGNADAAQRVILRNGIAVLHDPANAAPANDDRAINCADSNAVRSNAVPSNSRKENGHEE